MVLWGCGFVVVLYMWWVDFLGLNGKILLGEKYLWQEDDEIRSGCGD